MATPDAPERPTLDKSRYYATTPIFYVNAEPHIGHAYTTTLVDVATRFHRLKGDDTFFLTGTDEHGEKIQKAADAAGLSPQEYTDQIAQKFRDVWDSLEIGYDEFIRTTEERHKSVVHEVLQRVYDNGDIIFGEYGGLYCVGCERYYTEKELVDGKCPQHDIRLEYRSEENYFFRMEKYRPWLRDYLQQNPDFVRPERYRNEVLGMLREPIGDLSISRPRDRVPWGIPLPWDDKHVTYVWFDALVNYYSALESRELTDHYWPYAEHFIGKDILKPHGVFWPTMLKAAGLPIYQHLNVHGYWLTDQGKMSKSRGNVIRPLDLKDKYGNDAFRYYLLRDMTFGLDATFSEVGLAERINSDLANDLGNLLNRTLGMLQKYRDGVIPGPGETNDADAALQQTFAVLPAAVSDYVDKLQFERAIEEILEAVRHANRYVSTEEPWKLAKDEANAERLNTVLYHCAEALRCASVLLGPVIPRKAQELRQQLGLADKTYLLEEAGQWGLIPAGTATQLGEPLFPRIDMGALQEEIQVSEEPLEHKDEVTIDDFAKLEFRVAEVLEAEHHPKADKLLILRVKLGPEERTIVSGIREWYKPDELVGKKVIIVANLKPVKLRGTMSQGMILAAEDKDGNLSLAGLDRDLASGSEVR
ncbi:MAG: methionine--tRNA ligase [Trueperaceae bacterium]|nr:methionine--tRNA ligase [Trueperaceae bacterium]